MKEKTTKQLINNVIGQLNGVNKMLEDKKECTSVISQMKAAKFAIGSLMEKYIKENANECIGDLKGKDTEMLSKLIKELCIK